MSPSLSLQEKEGAATVWGGGRGERGNCSRTDYSECSMSMTGCIWLRVGETLMLSEQLITVSFL